MTRNVIFLYFLFFQIVFLVGQTGGYMGKKHNVTLSGNFHPVYYGYNYSRKPALSTLLSIRPGYELVLGKSFSVGVETGFQDFEVGEKVMGSILDQTSASPRAYYRFSGFDMKFRFRIYNYKSRGVIAPVGRYFTFLVGVPFYKSQISESVSIKNNSPSFGFEFGKQGVLYNYVTIDYGITMSVTGRYISNTYNEIRAEYGNSVNFDTDDLLFIDEKHVIDSYDVYGLTQLFGVYLKFGYML